MRTHRIRFAAAGVLLAAPLLLAGCGTDDPVPASSDDSTTTASANPSASSSSSEEGSGGETTEATITIKDFAYGDPLTVAPGTVVTVVNEDSAPHNANDADGAFEEPLLQQGETATFTAPEEAGTYDLVCTQHSDMSGELIVEG